MSDKRFTVTPTLDIKDNFNGRIYPIDIVHNHPYGLCSLLNDINDRADKNAELVDMSKINLMFQVEQYRECCVKMRRLLDKYEIENLEKLDLMLMTQKVW